MANNNTAPEASHLPDRVGVIDAFTELVERLWQYVHEADDLPAKQTPAVVRQPSKRKLTDRAE